MEGVVQLVLFYTSNELQINDIESEYFTDEREKVYFFMFHNKDLHFSKDIIFNKTLLTEFDKIKPEFRFTGNNVELKKVLNNFDIESFNKTVDFEFTEYTKRINYRIECVFQTFNLFIQLYKERNFVFVLPIEIELFFHKNNKDNGIICNENKNDNTLQSSLNLINWINYYQKKDINISTSNILNDENIVKSFVLQIT